MATQARLRIFTAHEYSISILFAGLTCTPPALGVATPLMSFVIIGAFCILHEKMYCNDPVTRALFERECARNPCRNELYVASSVPELTPSHRSTAHTHTHTHTHAHTRALARTAPPYTMRTAQQPQPAKPTSSTPLRLVRVYHRGRL